MNTKKSGIIHTTSDSIKIGIHAKKLEILNYYDKTIEISINEYGNEISKMLDEKETKALIDWLNSNCY